MCKIHRFRSMQKYTWLWQRTVNSLISLYECAGWSGPSLSPYAQKHVFHGTANSVLCGLLSINRFKKEESGLTLSTLWTKTDSFANSVIPDETAHHEPSHLDPHCLPFWSSFVTDIHIYNNGHIYIVKRKSRINKFRVKGLSSQRYHYWPFQNCIPVGVPLCLFVLCTFVGSAYNIRVLPYTVRLEFVG